MSVFHSEDTISFFSQQGVVYTNKVFVHHGCLAAWEEVQNKTLEGTDSRPGIHADEAGRLALRFLQSTYTQKNPTSDQVKIRKSEALSKHLNSEQFGVFAAKKIHAGQVVLEYGGCLAQEKLVRIWEKTYGQNRYVFTLGQREGSAPPYLYGGRWVIDGRKHGNEARYINHSQRHANLRVTEIFPKQSKRCEEVAETPHVIFVATRDIEEGEELFFDYQDSYWKGIGEVPLEIPAASPIAVQKPPLTATAQGMGGKAKPKHVVEKVASEKPAKRYKPQKQAAPSSSSTPSEEVCAFHYRCGMELIEKFRENQKAEIPDFSSLPLARECAEKIPADHVYAQKLQDQVVYEHFQFRIANLQEGIEKDNAYKRVMLMERSLRPQIHVSSNLEEGHRKKLLCRINQIIATARDTFSDCF